MVFEFQIMKSCYEGVLNPKFTLMKKKLLPRIQDISPSDITFLTLQKLSA